MTRPSLKNIISLFSKVFICLYFAISLFLLHNLYLLGLLNNLKSDTALEVMSNYHKEIKSIVEEKKDIVNKLIQTNVLINNSSNYSTSSGVVLHIDNNYYVLSASHILTKETDKVFVISNDVPYLLSFVKQDKKYDLSLFKFVLKPESLTPTKIALNEPNVGDPIIAVGNPDGMEDAVTRGHIIKKTKDTYFIDALIYFGSSGGGIFNNNGELVGINVAIRSKEKPHAPFVMFISESVKLEHIKEFLKDVK